MARGRMISKSLSTSERFARLFQVCPDLAEFAQSLFPLLVAHSDDFGRQAGDLFTVKHAVHPASPRSEQDFARGLGAMTQVELIAWYEAGNRRVIQIVKFEGHQGGLHKRTRSLFPGIPGNSGKLPNFPVPGISGNFPDDTSPVASVPGDSRTTELNRTELKDLDQEQRADARDSRSLGRLPGRGRPTPASFKVLEALAHDVLRDIEAGRVDGSSPMNEFKARISERNMTWDHDVDLPRKAFDSAEAQRQTRRRA